MNKLYFLIGASGAGKTTAVKELEKQRPDIKFCYSDSIGVPSFDDMVKTHGTIENWQKSKTIEWVKIIKRDFLSHNPVLLEGQSRPEFINAACLENGISDYSIILFDCSDEVRIDRLNLRNQPDLANQNMMDWARYLRNEANKYNNVIIDTSDMSIGEMVVALDKELV